MADRPHRRRDPTPEEAEAEREAARQRAAAWRLAPGNIDREKAAKAARREADPEGWQRQRRAAGDRYRDKNREDINARFAARGQRLRREALEAYGGKCACPGCHVVHWQLLTIDHVNGDGAEHRRALGRSTRDLYAWLKRHGYPEGFQAMCGSCNLAKAGGPACPLAGEPH